MDVEVKKRTRTRDAIKNTSLTTWIIENLIKATFPQSYTHYNVTFKFIITTSCLDH